MKIGLTIMHWVYIPLVAGVEYVIYVFPNWHIT
jgi:hypothetical protein